MNVILLVLLLCLTIVSSALAQTPFYQGKTVQIRVGFAAGGAFDVWARVIASHLGRFVPGNPTFVVQNMTGGGSMVAANYIYSVAKPDGLTLGGHGAPRGEARLYRRSSEFLPRKKRQKVT